MAEETAGIRMRPITPLGKDSLGCLAKNQQYFDLHQPVDAKGIGPPIDGGATGDFAGVID